MSKLDKAIERFTQALDRVEQLLAQKPSNQPAATPSQRELQILREDRVRLAEELDAVKADYAALESLTGEVELRVDSAIRDLRRVVGR